MQQRPIKWNWNLLLPGLLSPKLPKTDLVQKWGTGLQIFFEKVLRFRPVHDFEVSIRRSEDKQSINRVSEDKQLWNQKVTYFFKEVKQDLAKPPLVLMAVYLNLGP